MMKLFRLVMIVWIVILTSCSSIVGIYPTKMNYAYVNVRNPITVYSNRKINKVSTNNGLLHLYGNEAVFIPKNVGKSKIVIDYKGRQFVYDINVLPLDTSKVHAVLGPKSHNVQKDIGTYNRLFPVWDLDFEVQSHIFEFTVRLFDNQKVIREHRNKGSEFDEITKEILKNSTRGQTISFTEIELAFENGNFIALSPINVEITH